MFSCRIPVVRVSVVIALVLALLTAPGFAQSSAADAGPYDVSGLKPEKQWIPWAVTFAFTIGCVVLALKNPRRSHLD